MSDALNEINSFIEPFLAVPNMIAQFVTGMPSWLQFAMGLSVVLGLILIIIGLIK